VAGGAPGDVVRRKDASAERHLSLDLALAPWLVHVDLALRIAGVAAGVQARDVAALPVDRQLGDRALRRVAGSEAGDVPRGPVLAVELEDQRARALRRFRVALVVDAEHVAARNQALADESAVPQRLVEPVILLLRVVGGDVVE